jgi:hypothetical protein
MKALRRKKTPKNSSNSRIRVLKSYSKGILIFRGPAN